MSSSGFQEPFNVTQNAGVLPDVSYLLEARAQGIPGRRPGPPLEEIDSPDRSGPLECSTGNCPRT